MRDLTTGAGDFAGVDVTAGSETHSSTRLVAVLVSAKAVAKGANVLGALDAEGVAVGGGDALEGANTVVS